MHILELPMRCWRTSGQTDSRFLSLLISVSLLQKAFLLLCFSLFFLLFYFAFRLVRFSASSLYDTAPNVPSGSIFALT